MFALESLAIAGETHENSAAVRRACDFLVSKQMEDGGWGETYMVCPPLTTFGLIGPSPPRSPSNPSLWLFSLPNHSTHTRLASLPLGSANRQSCVSMQYAQHPQSQVVQTSWAVLALIYGEYPDVEVIKKACALLMSRQKEYGRWEQEDTEGIFNKNCAIDYPGTSLFFLLFIPSVPVHSPFFFISLPKHSSFSHRGWAMRCVALVHS
jgi:lanosterol synthase